MSPIRGVAAAVVVAVVLVAAVACSPSPPTPSAVQPSSAATSEPPPPRSASPTASPTLDAPPLLPPGVTVDPGLLEVLPTQVDGVTLEPDAGTAAQIGSDPLLAESVLSIALAIAVATGDQATSPTDDLAVASVIRLRPDVFDEAFYQEWRDTYNESACAVADGVESEDETEIDGRQVYVGTCAGGARTYHTYLADQGFIVSITATGERLFGERIMAGLAG